MPAFQNAFESHDHAHCADDVLARVRVIVQKNKLRLTPVRQRTLEILLESHKALGAYEVLERLAAEGFGHQPPVAYRALDYLVEQGLAHRIRRLNGFAACMYPGAEHEPAFLICKSCDKVAETKGSAFDPALNQAAKTHGFHIERSNIEAMGECASCKGVL